MKRQTILLIVVGLLLFIKFLYMPLIDMISEKHSLIESMQKRVAKGEALIETESALMAQEAKLDQYLGQSKANYPVVKSADITQLQFQRQIRNLADKHNISIESQEWTSTQTGTPSAAFLRIRVASNMENFPGFFMDLEKEGSWIALVDLNLDVKKQRLNYKRLGLTTGSLEFKISYMLEEVVDEL